MRMSFIGDSITDAGRDRNDPGSFGDGYVSLLAPEPSFLDARNAIFLADQTLNAGADTETLWKVFAARGMGFYAAAVDGDDTAPAESFALPPAARSVVVNGPPRSIQRALHDDPQPWSHALSRRKQPLGPPPTGASRRPNLKPPTQSS